MNLTELTLAYMKAHLESKDVRYQNDVDEIDFTDIIDSVLGEAELHGYSPTYLQTDEAYELVESLIDEITESGEWSKFVYDLLDERAEHRESQRNPHTYYNAYPKQL